ncbi:MAG: TRC40/GET3/ArsA family transport-energizing ATPase [Dehalococcoidia bacterium]|nr:TRC40/GET3/ArsA family transport-energizing ATPase [Dehalococcoidia bacterium]
MVDKQTTSSSPEKKPVRILLYTGKGGVGKTTMAAATALRAADLGYRTIVISTDAAHSLADSFDTQLSPVPVQIAPNLWGQEIDIYHELREHWGKIQSYVASVMAWRGLDDAVAQEMTVLPGMEEMASLLQITSYYDSGEFDVIIVDCAPTGETLRLLTFPEVARWWMEKMFPIERKAAHILRPLMKPFLDVPLPGDDVFASVKDLFSQLDRMHVLLADPEISSIRLVLNPEKMVVKEAQRTFTYLNLFGYPIDLVICNRMIPSSVQDSYFRVWKESQDKYLQLVEDAFAPLPILKVPLFDREVLGLDMLRQLAEKLYGEEDPSRAYFHGQTQTIEKRDGSYILTLPLPLISKEEVSLNRTGDELLIQIGNQRRNLILPKALVSLAIRQAKLDDGALKIVFAVPDAKTTNAKR